MALVGIALIESIGHVYIWSYETQVSLLEVHFMSSGAQLIIASCIVHR